MKRRPVPTMAEQAYDAHAEADSLLELAHAAYEAAYALASEAAHDHQTTADHHAALAAAATSHAISVENRRRRVVDALPDGA